MRHRTTTTLKTNAKSYSANVGTGPGSGTTTIGLHPAAAGTHSGGTATAYNFPEASLQGVPTR